ncbi:hypothetical protein Tco_0168912 [Tanacetum coccineum]
MIDKPQKKIIKIYRQVLQKNVSSNLVEIVDDFHFGRFCGFGRREKFVYEFGNKIIPMFESNEGYLFSSQIQIFPIGGGGKEEVDFQEVNKIKRFQQHESEDLSLKERIDWRVWKDFVPIGSTKEEELIKTMNEKATDEDNSNKEKVLEAPDSTKVEFKQEGHKDSTIKILGRRLKMKATKKSKRQKTYSDLEEEEQLKAFLMIVPDEE